MVVRFACTCCLHELQACLGVGGHVITRQQGLDLKSCQQLEHQLQQVVARRYNHLQNDLHRLTLSQDLVQAMHDKR